MTSHYLRCIVKDSFEHVYEKLKPFGNVHSRVIEDKGRSQVGILLGEEYFLRVGSDSAITIILTEQAPTETEVEVIGYAGGGGWMSISWGSHSAYVHKVKEQLIESRFIIESEIEYKEFSSSLRERVGEKAS